MENKINISVSNNISAEEDRVLREGIVSFNAQYTGDKPACFSVYAKNQHNEVIGGARVFAHKSSVFLDVLWVKNDYRHQGIGTQIVSAVEQESIKRKIPCVTLDTFDFQAENFYRKLGYQHIGTIANYLEGHDRIFLRKELLS